MPTQNTAPHAPLPDVLVVEDDPRVARLVKRCLTLHGYEVAGVVTSAAAALAALEAHQPSLVVMDIAIEGPMDGVELARTIHERGPLPIVYMSGQGDDETLRRAVSTGPFGFLRKPFDDIQLKVAIEVALQLAETDRDRDAELERAKRERGELAASSARSQARLRRIAEVVGVRQSPGTAVAKAEVPPHLGPRVASLSARERDVLGLLLAGYRVTSLGRALAVSPNTVRNHLRAVFRKLQVHSQEELIEMFRDSGTGRSDAGQ